MYARHVGIADEIFPKQRHPGLVQTEWAKGWVYTSIGFAGAARFLTEHSAQFGASIDQVGLVIFFLQRHRVELAIKELLAAHRIDLKSIVPPHSLDALWRACELTIGTDSEGWRYLDSTGTRLVKLLDKHDPGSHTYRYPIDRHGKEHRRPKYIDLVALENHVNELVSAIDGFMAHAEEARQYEQEMRREYEQELLEEYGEGY